MQCLFSKRKEKKEKKKKKPIVMMDPSKVFHAELWLAWLDRWLQAQQNICQPLICWYLWFWFVMWLKPKSSFKTFGLMTSVKINCGGQLARSDLSVVHMMIAQRGLWGWVFWLNCKTKFYNLLSICRLYQNTRLKCARK